MSPSRNAPDSAMEPVRVAPIADAAASHAVIPNVVPNEVELPRGSSTEPPGRIPVCVGGTEAEEDADPMPGAPLAFYLVAEFGSQNPWAGQDLRESNGRAVLYEALSAEGDDSSATGDAHRIRIGDPADASHDETYGDLEEPLGPWARDLRKVLLAATSEPLQNSGRPVFAFEEIRRREHSHDSAVVFDVRIAIDQGIVGNNIHGQGATMQLRGSVTTRGDLLVRARLVRTVVVGPEEAHFAGQPYNAARRVVRTTDVVSVSRRCTP